MTAETSSAMSRLCSACGMCCDGVLFPTVRLQPEESPKPLLALGMKLKYKDRHRCVIQPCQAHRGGQCTIYADRPQRCRLFECRQIQRFSAGEITEAAALEKIREARERVALTDSLLKRLGNANPKRSLEKRHKLVMAEPLDAELEPEKVKLRAELDQAIAELEALLEKDFRIEPALRETD